MFRDETEARATLAASLPKAAIEAVIALLRPRMVLAPVAGTAPPPLGATRIGGTPDLPPGLGWPVRAVSPDMDAIAARGGSNHAGHIRKHLELALPFEFLAQIDLAEAARLGPVAADLPPEGRLLVFYDSMTGPWDTGATTCRVLWDRSPAATLVRQPLPEIFEVLGREHAAETTKAFREYNLPPPSAEDLKPPYWGPPRAMRLDVMLGLTHTHTAEARTDPGLRALFANEKMSDALSGILGSVERHLLLGTPVPEQDDPRYDAVVVTTHGVQHLERDRWRAEREAIFAAAADWRLLLQVSMPDYLQQRTEGTVYFLIRTADLAARDFGRVVAVYQQT